MNDNINITIKFGKSDEDLAKLKRIMKEMEELELKAKDEEEGRRLVKEELERRLREAGLTR